MSWRDKRGVMSICCHYRVYSRSWVSEGVTLTALRTRWYCAMFAAVSLLSSVAGKQNSRSKTTSQHPASRSAPMQPAHSSGSERCET